VKSCLINYFNSGPSQFKVLKNIEYYKTFSFLSKSLDQKDIIICGASRSGSTLLYNIVRYALVYKYLNSEMPYFRNSKEYTSLVKNAPFQYLMKTHSFSIVLGKRIEANRSIGFFSHRNILDILASSIQKGWIKNVEEALEKKLLEGIVLNAILFKRLKGIHSVSYFDLLNNKQKVYNLVANVFDFDPTDFSEYVDPKVSLNAVKNKLSSSSFNKVGENQVNASSGYHKNHINNPTIGKWRSVIRYEEANKVLDHPLYKLYCKEFDYSAQLTEDTTFAKVPS